MRHYKTLTWNDRLQIEAWLRVDTPVKVIAEQLGVHISTVYREIKRGQYEHLNSDWTTETRYSPEISEQKKQDNLRAKGGDLKIGNDVEYANYLEYKVCVEKYAPGAILGEIKRKGLQFQTSISKTTFYRILKAVFSLPSPIKTCRSRKTRPSTNMTGCSVRNARQGVKA